jgi:hypothetical protein
MEQAERSETSGRRQAFSPVLPTVPPTEGTPPAAAEARPTQVRDTCADLVPPVLPSSATRAVRAACVASAGRFCFSSSFFFPARRREGEQGEHVARSRVERASRRSPYRGER